MSDIAWAVVRVNLLLSCASLIAALALLISIGDINTDNIHLYLTARELINIPPALLFVTGIGTVCIEERVIGKRR
jgi:hypothetical protein